MMEDRGEVTVEGVAVCPGLVFIEKLPNDDLMMTSFVALQ